MGAGTATRTRGKGGQGECLVAGFIITRCVASRLVADASPFAREGGRGAGFGLLCSVARGCESVREREEGGGCCCWCSLDLPATFSF